MATNLRSDNGLPRAVRTFVRPKLRVRVGKSLLDGITPRQRHVYVCFPRVYAPRASGWRYWRTTDLCRVWDRQEDLSTSPPSVKSHLAFFFHLPHLAIFLLVTILIPNV